MARRKAGDTDRWLARIFVGDAGRFEERARVKDQRQDRSVGAHVKRQLEAASRPPECDWRRLAAHTKEGQG